jgi:type VI secretion system protein ImpL
MPEHASATGWRRRLAPKIDTVFDDLASEAGWVLGDAGAEVQRLNKDRAWREEIARQVGRRHAERVVAAWSRQIEPGPAPAPDPAAATRPAIALTAPDSSCAASGAPGRRFSATPEGSRAGRLRDRPAGIA